jgi:hypothetical protein
MSSRDAIMQKEKEKREAMQKEIDKETKKTKAPKEKKVKEVKPVKIYYGPKDPPPQKNQRHPTMSEAVQSKQGVKYYGVNKLDSKMLEIINKPKAGKSPEALLQVKGAGLRGKLKNIKKKYDASDKPDERKKLMEQYEEVKEQLLDVGKQLEVLKKK